MRPMFDGLIERLLDPEGKGLDEDARKRLDLLSGDIGVLWKAHMQHVLHLFQLFRDEYMERLQLKHAELQRNGLERAELHKAFCAQRIALGASSFLLLPISSYANYSPF